VPTVTMSAVIPTQAYGNIQPTFTTEGDTHEEAMNLGLAQMKAVWDRAAEKPLLIRDMDHRGSTLMGKDLVCWASGTRVNFEPVNHVYDSGDGRKWLSGSTFAGKFKGHFNAPIVAGKMAAKHDVDPQEIVSMWELNRDASSTVGSSVHMALQLRGQYANLSRAVKDGSLESATTKNPILIPIVDAFFATREHEDARYEVFVADPVRAHCGFIDRLVIEDDGLIVEDYKTNSELFKSETIRVPFKGKVPNTKLGAYWLQLSFYARILESHGKHVKLLRIHHWTTLEDGTYGWVSYEYDPIDLDAAFKEGKPE
jgi:hypothetical protein